jgi:hypothetical protein
LEFVNNEIRQAASQKVRGVAEITQLTRNPAPSPRGSLARLRSRSCIIDGEAVACDDNGVASFDLVRHHRANENIFLYAFDLIELNGDDLSIFTRFLADVSELFRSFDKSPLAKLAFVLGC